MKSRKQPPTKKIITVDEASIELWVEKSGPNYAGTWLCTRCGEGNSVVGISPREDTTWSILKGATENHACSPRR